MLLSTTVVTKWGCRNKKKFTDLGYIFTKHGDEVEIKVEDLPLGTNVKVMVQCDYCNGEPYEMTWASYNKRMKQVDKLACNKCKYENAYISNQKNTV